MTHDLTKALCSSFLHNTARTFTFMQEKKYKFSIQVYEATSIITESLNIELMICVSG